MGQKVNPIGIRLGVNRTWNSFWFSDRFSNYDVQIYQDVQIERWLNSVFARMMSYVKSFTIHRSPGLLCVNVVIGQVSTRKPKRRSSGNRFTLPKWFIRYIEWKLATFAGVKKCLVSISIAKEDSQLSAAGLANSLVSQLTISNYRSIFRLISRKLAGPMDKGLLKGYRISISGRLGRQDRARVESFKKGQIPLHTLTNKIDYARAGVESKFGTMGIKVWMFY